MKPSLLCLFLLLYTCTCLPAVNNLRTADMRSVGMGGNEAVHSILFNPALVALTAENSLRFTCSNRYALKELNTINGSIYLFNKYLPAGLDFFSFGYDAYRETLFRISLGKQLNEKWVLGVSFQYALLQTELYEQSPARLSTDIGIVYLPVDNLLIGLSIVNLPSVAVGNKSAEIEDFISYLIQTGFRWEIINNMFISSTLESSRETKIAAAFGLEYLLFDSFAVRAGVGGKPFLPSFGMGYRFSRFTVDTAVAYHAVLGVSTGIGLIFSF